AAEVRLVGEGDRFLDAAADGDVDAAAGEVDGLAAGVAGDRDDPVGGRGLLGDVEVGSVDDVVDGLAEAAGADVDVERGVVADGDSEGELLADGDAGARVLAEPGSEEGRVGGEGGRFLEAAADGDVDAAAGEVDGLAAEVACARDGRVGV